jgi:hypothetical protein
VVPGLPIPPDAILPFLLTARAQGQLAQTRGTRAFFAEGLASSYEAFHHTREGRKKALDADDGIEGVDEDATELIIPTRWYEEQVASLIPSRKASASELLRHPKIAATVSRSLSLWEQGEKVLVFCFYRETAKALRDHLQEAVEARILDLAARKLGVQSDPERVKVWLGRIARRLTDEDSPFYRGMRDLLAKRVRKHQSLKPYAPQLISVLTAYFRSPAFIARYLPLEDRQVRQALEEGETRREIIARGVEALQTVLLEGQDHSGQTYMGRVDQFLEFADELAERTARHVERQEDEEIDECDDPLDECLKAIAVYTKPRRPGEADRDDAASEDDTDDGSYRVLPLVRMVYGDTKPDVRDRLMQAFNSPLFPEILVSSSVMGEGVDLHRFCRHVIHHDLCWNPSTLEQRTGRIDRIRCKAEVCCRPIQVYEPFLAGSADEKMFRVVRDRERWFQIVMGQKFEFDEATSEAIARRVPLPSGLAQELIFCLARWRPPVMVPDREERAAVMQRPTAVEVRGEAGDTIAPTG